jgi:adenosylmethionine-8-amino-7-oxononanoate aminotransferase
LPFFNKGIIFSSIFLNMLPIARNRSNKDHPNGAEKDGPFSTSTPKSHVLHRSLHDQPKKVIGADGIYLTLSNGQRILDATGGAAVACLGHNHPRIKRAIAAQMDKFSYCHSLFFSSDAAEDLCKLLIDSTDGAMSRAFIVSSGSEAMEAAIKMARQYFLELDPPQTGRVRFIARRESYHGTTLGALGIGGHVARRALYEPLLSGNVSHVSACNVYRGMRNGETELEYVARLQRELDDEFQRVGPETVCAFVMEPVVGAALGCVPAAKGYTRAMKSVCDKYGALLILDEVMCGMGRCGTMHAWMEEGVAPDLQTIGKGLGGGYAPVAGMLVGHRVVDVLTKGTGAFSHGQTYQGHPIACAAALEVQRVIQDDLLVDRVHGLGLKLENLLRDSLECHPHVGNIRGRGFFWGIEFVKDRSSKEPFDPSEGVAMGIHNLGMKEPFNISIYPGSGTVDGKRGDHVLIAPAYTISEEDLKDVVRRTAAVIREFFELAGRSSELDENGILNGVHSDSQTDDPMKGIEGPMMVP